MNTPTISTAVDTLPLCSLELIGADHDRFNEILTAESLVFLGELHARFATGRHEMLALRMKKRARFNNGLNLSFLSETQDIRNDLSWKVAKIAPGLEDRRVEITGPTDRKMTINALNSGANCWLADFEDATSPSWFNIIDGQINLYDAIRNRADFTTAEGKEYRLNPGPKPTIIVRPRGWHLVEKHLNYTSRNGMTLAASASLVDFGLYFFHNARQLIENGQGPYFYLPKLESHLEARLWAEIFAFSEEYLGIEAGTIRATVLIETIPAAFEMEEILYELRHYSAGLNAGRWDYIFSIIKNFRSRGMGYVLPDRADITMTVPFMRAYTELLVKSCHKRGAHAMGGMSACIPNRNDPAVTEQAFAQVHADKKREANDGFDGTWVAHPDLIPIAREEFDAVLGGRANQIERQRDDVQISANDLLNFRSAAGAITDAGVHGNVSVTLRYLEAWLRGFGAVAIDNLMEDAATAEISRSQIWQWLHNDVVTREGTHITREWIERLMSEILNEQHRSAEDCFDEAVEIFREVALGQDFPTFLTLGAYARHLVA
ncbi:MAG: malate synthase A [Microbacteriaceae bacterium]